MTDDGGKRQQRRATGRYERALKSGKLMPADRCEICQKICHTNGHHWRGYEDAHALDVQWLCQSCHNSVHSGRAGGRARAESQTPKQRSALARSGGLAFAAKWSSEVDWAAMGRKGGTMAASRMTPEQRSERARHASRAKQLKRQEK